MMTVRDFKVAMGYDADGWVHERQVGDYVQTYWPSPSGGGAPGWCWCVSKDGQWLGGAWCVGSVRERNLELAQFMMRLRANESRGSRVSQAELAKIREGVLDDAPHLVLQAMHRLAKEVEETRIADTTIETIERTPGSGWGPTS